MIHPSHSDPVRTPPWIDARTGIDMSKWTRNPEILALLDRRLSEIRDLADRIEHAPAKLTAYLKKQGKIP